MIAGVDEAGRGPLAGPVVAASVILPNTHSIIGLNDSKKLSSAKRERLYKEITSQAVAWAFSMGSSHEVDLLNIRGATLLAMKRSVESLRVSPTLVLVDGRDTLDLAVPCEAVIKGDQKELAIMAASIVAKKIRDNIMHCLGIRFPQYGFAAHSGYPTKQHREMLQKYGQCIHHRKTFCKER